MTYDDHEATVEPGECVLFHSNGLFEAHNEQGEMFGTPRLRGLVENAGASRGLIKDVLDDLNVFAGRNWAQEDDITLVTLHRCS